MHPLFAHSLRGCAGLALALALAGCNGDRADITASLPDTVEARHPIQVIRGMANLDVLPGGGPGGLTDRQVADIRSFAAGWTANGRSQLVIEAPMGAGPAADAQANAAIGQIRRQILAVGVPARAIGQTRYPVNGPDHLAPVRLSYSVLEARVPHSCDVGAEDAGYSDPGAGFQNRQTWNFGCAQQQNIAAMVDDPEDFIRPRADDPAYASRRGTVLTKYRTGQPTPGAQTSAAQNTQ